MHTRTDNGIFGIMAHVSWIKCKCSCPCYQMTGEQVYAQPPDNKALSLMNVLNESTVISGSFQFPRYTSPPRVKYCRSDKLTWLSVGGRAKLSKSNRSSLLFSYLYKNQLLKHLQLIRIVSFFSAKIFALYCLRAAKPIRFNKNRLLDYFNYWIKTLGNRSTRHIFKESCVFLVDGRANSNAATATFSMHLWIFNLLARFHQWEWEVRDWKIGSPMALCMHLIEWLLLFGHVA